MTIWQHTDEDGDRARITRGTDDDLDAYRLHIPKHGDFNGRTVLLDRSDLDRLHTALGEELDINPTKINGENAAVLGSSRRAQDEPVNLAEGPDDAARRLAGELWRLGSGLAELGIPLDETVSVDQAPVTTALAVLRARPLGVAPSQGQEIPDDQADALFRLVVDLGAAGMASSDAVKQGIQVTYRIGYAAALGYEITVEGGLVGVGDRPEPTRPEPAAPEESIHAWKWGDSSELAEARKEATRLRAERDEYATDYRAATEQAEIARATLATVKEQRDQLAARLAELGEDLGDPPVVDVDELLAQTRAALEAAVDDQERADIVEDLLQEWYAAWPDTALTSPHAPIAGELVRLLQPGPVTLTIPQELLTQITHGCPEGPHGPHLRTDVGPNDLLIRSACLGATQEEAPSA